MKKILSAIATISLFATISYAQELPAPKKEPTLQDYQIALVQLRGKQEGLNQVKAGIEQLIQENFILMDRAAQKINELTPKAPAPEAKKEEKKEKK
jgi:hypothetical protein